MFRCLLSVLLGIKLAYGANKLPFVSCRVKGQRCCAGGWLLVLQGFRAAGWSGQPWNGLMSLWELQLIKGTSVGLISPSEVVKNGAPKGDVWAWGWLGTPGSLGDAGPPSGRVQPSEAPQLPCSPRASQAWGDSRCWSPRCWATLRLGYSLALSLAAAICWGLCCDEGGGGPEAS